MLWLFIVIFAYLFYALSFVVDKYILSAALPHPIVYAFYVGVLSVAICVLIPFGFHFIGPLEFMLVLLSGLMGMIGNVLFYKALHNGEASRIVPFIGGFVAIFTLIFSAIFLKENLVSRQFLAFGLLVLGSLILSFQKRKFFTKPFIWALMASFCFAAFWVMTKFIFLDTNFINGVIWVRMGTALASLLLLIPGGNRKLIFQKTKKTKPKTAGIFVLGRASSILGAAGVYFAVYLGSVSLTNALQGIQYAFVFILALLLFAKFPSMKEEIGRKIIIQKIVAILLICSGLFLLVI